MHLIRSLNATGKESGQILVLSALLLPLLLLFVGMGIDFGFGYLTRAQLAKAADAASLTAMRNLGQGQATATTLALSVFASNPTLNSTLYTSAPSATITYSTDANNEPVVNVAATATIRTFFIRYAGFKTLTVANASQATRPPVILSLVLDRSGSMAPPTGGGATLPAAVTDFLYYFIEGTDQLGEASFSTTDKVDVAITKTFQTAINTSVSNFSWAGATFAQGGLLDGQAQVQGVASPPANAVKVVVYFTDGWANTNQDSLKCGSGSTLTLVNYGGYDVAAGNTWDFFSPTRGTNTTVTCNATKFPTTDPALPNPDTISRADITTEGEYRAVTLANQMRAQGITVYSIGLGAPGDIDETYLQEVANDPASPTYDSSKPSGLAEFAPTKNDLDTAFQTIASKILLRLTH